MLNFTHIRIQKPETVRCLIYGTSTFFSSHVLWTEEHLDPCIADFPFDILPKMWPLVAQIVVIDSLFNPFYEFLHSVSSRRFTIFYHSICSPVASIGSKTVRGGVFAYGGVLQIPLEHHFTRRCCLGKVALFGFSTTLVARPFGGPKRSASRARLHQEQQGP